MKTTLKRVPVDRIRQERDEISATWTERERTRRANIAALRQEWILKLIVPSEPEQPQCA